MEFLKDVHPLGRAKDVPCIVSVKLIFDQRGTLGVIEGGDAVGFDVQRFYFLTDFANGAERGAHAHKRLRQCLICLRGHVSVELIGASGRHVFDLDSSGSCLLIPPGYWRVLKSKKSDSLVGVLASEHYDELDYIRDFDEFLQWMQASPDTPEVSYLSLGRYVDRSYVGELADELKTCVSDQLLSGEYIGGSVVTNFEESFSGYCDAAAAVGVANGLEALQLGLLEQKIGPGDEVIVPSHTFVATALAVTLVGATPVLVDVDDETGLIDPELVAAAVTSRTRAIIPVHLYGHPADMDPLAEIANKNRLFLLEDAAQAHGAKYKGRKCGSLGDAAAFSFYPTKNLGAIGDGGAVTTRNADLAKSIRQLANYGATRRYHHDRIGMNSRLDPIQASVLSRKLLRLDVWNCRRRELASRYMGALTGLDGLSLPVVRSWAEPVWHVFPVRIGDGRRDELQQFMATKGVGTNIHYPLPVHRQACYADKGWKFDQFPVADRIARETLSLPLDPLHRDEEIERVIDVVSDFFR